MGPVGVLSQYHISYLEASCDVLPTTVGDTNYWGASTVMGGITKWRCDSFTQVLDL